MQATPPEQKGRKNERSERERERELAAETLALPRSDGGGIILRSTLSLSRCPLVNNVSSGGRTRGAAKKSVREGESKHVLFRATRVPRARRERAGYNVMSEIRASEKARVRERVEVDKEPLSASARD